ncbi:hypothetical protein CEUSTIGMA_g10757.t1 [Chlamydomonas eustigma]|uniref:AAA+ ATPase domain-containing protein n=1 Tax=Chlamydomonas eustigma TaxID=1157962 RepID=A0A250XJR5_9CHLO|nr:hypothetical protein CEUSTIGMA_g10757.t1 [Chlamydomonas eustigma]|eukprot:GAX83331.1 hypothetical protein CEUSTIGMA_g10757.t1 [Chlamydomonas eustigma]
MSGTHAPDCALYHDIDVVEGACRGAGIFQLMVDVVAGVEVGIKVVGVVGVEVVGVEVAGVEVVGVGVEVAGVEVVGVEVVGVEVVGVEVVQGVAIIESQEVMGVKNSAIKYSEVFTSINKMIKNFGPKQTPPPPQVGTSIELSWRKSEESSNLIFEALMQHAFVNNGASKTSWTLLPRQGWMLLTSGEVHLKKQNYTISTTMSTFSGPGELENAVAVLASTTEDPKMLRLFLDDVCADSTNVKSSQFRRSILDMCASKVSPFRDGLDPRMQRIGRVASAPKDLMFEMHPMHSSKTFESLCGPEIRELQKRVLFFQNNRDWYEKRGIPYQLGIMLTGECGTGKSSAIRALANVTKRNIVNVNLANVTTMTQLKNLFCKGTIFVDGCMMNFPIHERIFVLDEVDALGLGLSFMRTSADAVPDEVNLGELLTLFDGGIEVPGRIIVLITNRPERLDRALVRPGRIDLHLKLGLASRKTLSDMYEVFFEEPLEAVRMEELPHEILSPAQAVEALKGVASQGLSSPEECVNAAIAAFKDMVYQDKNDETQMFAPSICPKTFAV